MSYTKGFMKIFKTATLCILTGLIVISCGCGNVSVYELKNQAVMQYTLPPVSEQPKPAGGGELTFPIPDLESLVPKETLNPLKTKNVELCNLFSLIYEQPIRMGNDGTFGPELAETWSVDDSGTDWTFNLRKGVKWQNGKGDFSADDVIYTIGLIKGYSSSVSDYAKYNDIIDDCKKIDANKVEIKLKEPGNAALYFMTFPILCKSYCESNDIDDATPIGTGSYNVKSYDKSKQMVFQANSSWWKQTPYIKNLTAVCYPQHTDELNAFSANKLNFLTTSTITVDTLKKYGVTASEDYLTQYYDCLVPNSKSGMFNDTNMRLALSLCLDKREIVSKALLGHAVATDYPVPPDSFLTGGASTNYEYNTTKAAALFEQAGWKDRDGDGILEKVDGTQLKDLTINLLIQLDKEDTYRRDVANNIKSQLLKCGIDIVVVEEDKTKYASDLTNGNFDLALCSFYLDQNPDVSFMTGSGGSANYGGFSDSGYDTLLESCKKALDEDSMKKAYIKMEDSFLQLAPQVSLYFRTNTLLYNATLNVSSNIRERNVFNTIPQWYLYMSNSDKGNPSSTSVSASGTNRPSSPSPTVTPKAGSSSNPSPTVTPKAGSSSSSSPTVTQKPGSSSSPPASVSGN